MNKYNLYYSLFLVLLFWVNLSCGFTVKGEKGYHDANSIKLSKDGKLLFKQKIKKSVDSVYVIDLEKGETIFSIVLYLYNGLEADISNSFRLIGYLDKNHQFIIYDIERKVKIKEIMTGFSEDYDYHFAFSANDSLLYCTQVKYRDWEQDCAIIDIYGSSNVIYHPNVSFVANKSTAISSYQNIYRIDRPGEKKCLKKGSPEMSCLKGSEPIESITWDSSGAILVINMTRPCLAVWDINTFKKKYEINDNCNISGILSPSGNYLGTVNSNDEIKLYNASNGEFLCRLINPNPVHWQWGEELSQEFGRQLRFDGHDKYVFLNRKTSEFGDEVLIWDFKTKKLRKVLSGNFDNYVYFGKEIGKFPYFITIEHETDFMFWKIGSFKLAKKVVSSDKRYELNFMEIKLGVKYYVFSNNGTIEGEYSRSVIKYFKD